MKKIIKISLLAIFIIFVLGITTSNALTWTSSTSLIWTSFEEMKNNRYFYCTAPNVTFFPEAEYKEKGNMGSWKNNFYAYLFASDKCYTNSGNNHYYSGLERHNAWWVEYCHYI